jgi:hypothetical protein
MDSPKEVEIKGRKPERLAVRTDAKGNFKYAGRGFKLSDILSIRVPWTKPDEMARWSGNVGLSVTVTDGNTRDTNVHGELNLVRDQSHPLETLRNRFTAGAKYDYGFSNGEKTRNKGWAGAKLDIFIVDCVGAYLDGAVSFDELAGVDRKTRAGFGATCSSGIFGVKYALSAGISYMDIVYDETPKRRDTDMYLKAALSVSTALPLDFDLSAEGEIYLNLSDTDAYLGQVGAALSKKLGGGWFIRGSVEYEYNSRPAQGKLRGDTAYNLSLVLKF